MSDISIRKVKVLQGRAKAEAEKQGLNPEDLVIVKTSVNSGSLPNYYIEKIEGDPVSYLLKRIERETQHEKN
jgi:ribosomal protein L22